MEGSTIRAPSRPRGHGQALDNEQQQKSATNTTTTTTTKKKKKKQKQTFKVEVAQHERRAHEQLATPASAKQSIFLAGAGNDIGGGGMSAW